MPIEELKMTYKLLLDKSTMLFGESKSGKSTIIRHMMSLLNPHIEQVIVISSSDDTNKTYGGVTVPRPCVHKVITDKLLNDVWQRQQALSNIYKRASDLTVLKRMFNEIATPTARHFISLVHDYRAKCERELREESTGDVSAKLEEINADVDELVIKTYKHFIGQNVAHFNQKKNLSKNEKLTIQYLNLNPRLLWIFDDCTSQLERFKKHPVIHELFWQGRWSFITVIIATHTDKSFPPEIKSGTFLKIFAQETIARAYYLRESTAIDRAKRNEVIGYIDETFTPAKKFQKLAYNRETSKFYKYTADIVPEFRFGSPIIWQFCDLIASESDAMQNNKFMSKFE